MPPETVQVIPEIPGQTALIVYEEGMETLVVESSMKAEEGNEFAWILPLPSEPISIEEASPGILRTLRFCIGPEVKGAEDTRIVLAVMAFIYSFLIALMFAAKSPKLRNQASEVLIIIVIITLLAMISVGSFLSTRAADRNKVEVISKEAVGNYDTVTLRAESASDLAGWLEENGFAGMPETFIPVVDDYIKDEWIFLCSKLKRSGSGILEPHPLKVKFASREPVYPMRLTALGGTRTDINIFLASDKAFHHKQMKTIFRDRFNETIPVGKTPVISMDKMPRGIRERESSPGSERKNRPLYSTSFDAEIAHQGALEILPDECWITLLEGNLESEDMKEDFIFKQVDKPEPFMRTLYSGKGAAFNALTHFFFIMAGFQLILGIIYRINRMAAKKTFIAGLAIIVVYGLLVYAGAEKTGHTRMISRSSIRYRGMSRLRADLPYIITDDMTREEKKQTVRTYIKEHYYNVYTGEEIKERDAPGDFTFGQDAEGNTIVLYYRENGRSEEISLNP